MDEKLTNARLENADLKNKLNMQKIKIQDLQSQIHTERKQHNLEMSESKENLDPITYRKDKASSVNDNQIQKIMDELQK